MWRIRTKILRGARGEKGDAQWSSLQRGIRYEVVTEFRSEDREKTGKPKRLPPGEKKRRGLGRTYHVPPWTTAGMY